MAPDIKSWRDFWDNSQLLQLDNNFYFCITACWVFHIYSYSCVLTMTVIKENTMEARSPRSGLSSTVRMNVTTQTTFTKNNRTNVIHLPWVVISNKSHDHLRPLKRQQSLGFKCAHHVNFVGPPQCRNVQKLLHHAMEVDIDDGGQHSLDSQHWGLRNIPAPCMLILTHNSVNKIHRITYQKLLLQCSRKSLDMDALVGLFFFKYLWQIFEEDADPKCDEEDNDSWKSPCNLQRHKDKGVWTYHERDEEKASGRLAQNIIDVRINWAN